MRSRLAILPLIFLFYSQIVKKIEGLEARNKELVMKYKKEMALRKNLQNELVELKGNKDDGGRTDVDNVITFDEDNDTILQVYYEGEHNPFELEKVKN